MFATLLLALLPVLWLLPEVGWFLPRPDTVGAAQLHACLVGTAVAWTSRSVVRWREILWAPALMLPALRAGTLLDARPEDFPSRAWLLIGWCVALVALARGRSDERRAEALLLLALVLVAPPLVGLFADGGAHVSRWSPWTAALETSAADGPWRPLVLLGLVAGWGLAARGFGRAEA